MSLKYEPSSARCRSVWLWHIASRKIVATMPTCGAVNPYPQPLIPKPSSLNPYPQTLIHAKLTNFACPCRQVQVVDFCGDRILSAWGHPMFFLGAVCKLVKEK